MQKTRIGLRGLCEARNYKVRTSAASRNREIGISYLETTKRDDILNRFRKPKSYIERMRIQVNLSMWPAGRAPRRCVRRTFYRREKKWAVVLKCATRWDDRILVDVLTWHLISLLVMLLPFTKLFSPEVRVFDLLCRSTLPCVRSQPKRKTFRAEGIYKNLKTRPTKVRFM